MKKHKVLFLFYFFPPIASTATRRNTYIFKYFKSYFNDYFVFSTKNQHFFPKDNIYENLRGNDEKLTLLTTIDFRTIGHWFRPRKSSLKKTIHLDENIKKYKVVQFFQKMLDGFPFNLILQEGGIIYSCISIYKGYRLIKKEKITHIWSSFRPYSDHFSAYILKRLLPDLVWIADFRDLHVEPLYQNVYFVPFQHWCNRKIIKRANIVTTISEGLANHLKAYNNSVYVLRSGIVFENDISTAQKPTKFSIVYTGAMFRDERNPTLLMEVVKQLSVNNIISPENFDIIYAGRDAAIFKNYIDRFDLNNFFDDKGMLSTKEAINLQNSAHINLLLTSATIEWTGVMTGKLGEYLSAKKPLVVLIDGTKDTEYEDLINNLNAGCVVYNNQSFNKLYSFILEKFNEWQSTGDVKPTIDEEKLKELSWENQVQKFVEHINL
jgi:glycosyltransferase involved in cell wall biosynthesis